MTPSFTITAPTKGFGFVWPVPNFASSMACRINCGSGKNSADIKKPRILLQGVQYARVRKISTTRVISSSIQTLLSATELHRIMLIIIDSLAGFWFYPVTAGEEFHLALKIMSVLYRIFCEEGKMGLERMMRSFL